MKLYSTSFILILMIFIPIKVYALPGCCSHHGGQDYCGINKKWICSDGWESSCSCIGENKVYGENNDFSFLSWLIVLALPMLGVIIFIYDKFKSYRKKLNDKKDNNSENVDINENFNIMIIILVLLLLIILLGIISE